MKGLVGVGIAATVVVVGLLRFGGTPALATNVQCGQTITQDTVLTSDLDCTNTPATGAILIAAPDVTLDLNGHTIFLANGQGGIFAEEPAVTIENGNIVGVGNNNDFALPCNTAIRADEGGATIRDMNIIRCLGGIGMAGGNSLSNNAITGNEIREYATAADDLLPVGIYINPRESSVIPRNNVISRNVVSNSPASGPFDQERGIDVFTFDSRIERNVIAGNVQGLLVAGANDVVDRNSVTRNDASSTVPTFSIYAMRAALGGGQVTRNVVSDDRGPAAAPTGIELEFEPGFDATPTLVEKNSATGFRNDGIQQRLPAVPVAPSFVVRKNRANFNGNYGIEVAPTVIDGGGNKAKGNANPLQCLNVFCK